MCGKSFPPHAPSQRFWRIVLWWPGAIPRTGATAVQCEIAWNWPESKACVAITAFWQDGKGNWFIILCDFSEILYNVWTWPIDKKLMHFCVLCGWPTAQEGEHNPGRVWCTFIPPMGPLLPSLMAERWWPGAIPVTGAIPVMLSSSSTVWLGRALMVSLVVVVALRFLSFP